MSKTFFAFVARFCFLLILAAPIAWAQARSGSGTDQGNVKHASGADVPNARVDFDSESPILQTDRTEIFRVFSDQQIRELPLPNRNFENLIDLMSGITPPEPGLTPLLNPQQGNFYHVNGQWRAANHFQFDGLENTEPLFGFPIYRPQAEAAQEFFVTAGNYNAQQGQAGGGVFNVITRDGVNAFHGSLFEFHTNNRLRARNFFNIEPQPKPVFIRNQFGAALSGPIIRDKMFWFASYEGNYTRGSRTQITTVPLAAWRTGNFINVPGLILFNPATGNPATGAGRVTFPDNVIPANQINPVAEGILPLIPLPNLPGLQNNLAVNVPVRNDGNIFDGRLDHHFTDRTSAFVKYNFSRYFVVENSPLGPAIAESAESRIRNHTAAVNVNHGFTPTLLSEFRFGYQQYNPVLNAANTNEALANQLRFQNPNPFSIQGVPRIQIAGMEGIGASAFAPTSIQNNVLDWATSWGYTLNRHNLKWGAELQRLRMSGLSPLGLGFAPNGLFTFNPGTTLPPGGFGIAPSGAFAHSFAAFLVGAPTQTSLTFQTGTPALRQWRYFTFVHDAFRVMPKLTLDLGLRYEIYGMARPRLAGGAANYDPVTNSLQLWDMSALWDVGCPTVRSSMRQLREPE